jgi:hypothetical protein
MFTITIGKADTSCPDKITLTSGMVNAVQVAFAFSEEWEGFDKIAVFSNGATTVDVTLDEKDRCYVPHEVLSVAGRDVNVGVYGSKGEGEDYVAIPTEKCSLGKVSEGVDPSGEESAEPTPTIWDDLNIRVGNLETRMDEHTHDVASYSYGEMEFTEDNVTIVSGTEHANWSGNAFSTNGDEVVYRIAVSGHAEFSGNVGGVSRTITVDGKTQVSVSDDYTFNYSGEVKEYIEIQVYQASVTFISFTVETSKDGFMTGEDKAKLDSLEETVGDFDTALDELHAYAQGLISGGASE